MSETITPASIKKLFVKFSPWWKRQLDLHPEDLSWLEQEKSPGHSRTLQGLQSCWRGESWAQRSKGEVFHVLRRVKRQEMLRISVRDLMGMASLPETVSEISALADFCLQRGLEAVLKDMIKRHGEPDATFSIMGMGKLGGQELNYSSDIDLIFVYSDEGSVGRISHHEFFKRMAEELMEGFRGSDEEGSLFRVDLRLRPEGNSGPIVRSLESYENYYAAFGEVWERMALQKARLTAGDQELGYEFSQHLQPFCFPKHLPPTALDEIFEIKGRIEAEILKEGGLERHVKLGRGGIREIEFSIQALQLLHGAKHAFSQERGTLKSIQALTRLELLSGKDARTLTEAYIFLRRLEHRLQMQEDRQTHTVPEDPATRKRIAESLGFKTPESFEGEWKVHTGFVRKFFHDIVRPTHAEKTEAMIWEWEMDSDLCRQTLKEAGFQDVERALSIFHTLSRGPEYAHVSQRTRRMFDQLAPHLLKLAPELARPDEVVQQLERFIEAYGSRASLYELLTSNPKMLELLFRLFDRSRFLTRLIIHQPELIDAIAFNGLLMMKGERKRLEMALKKEEGESPAERLRTFRNAEMLRMGLRDIMGLEPSLENTWGETSLLADICLAEAVRTSIPKGKSKVKADPFCVMALGKYGGLELGYGSDLDVIFIGGTPSMAANVISVMGQEMKNGIVFKVDARLRPDGEDGPLSLPLKAYEKYYRERAQFWEKQALTRARFAAGDPRTGEAFLRMVDDILYRKAASEKELKELQEMRLRIEKERGDSADPVRDFKTGAGGLVDAEFLAQRQLLIHGCRHPGIRRQSTLGVLQAMPGVAKWPEKEVLELVKNHLWLRRLEGVMRCFENAPISQMPEDREEWRAAAHHLGLKDPAALEKELAARRKQIRKICWELMGKEKA